MSYIRKTVQAARDKAACVSQIDPMLVETWGKGKVPSGTLHHLHPDHPIFAFHLGTNCAKCAESHR